MLTFTKIMWKNFLSTGNIFTELVLTDTQNLLILGKNGQGKSTLLDAMTYVLFNKAFRNINLPLLVNSINEKNCVVEIEFTTNGKNYRIVRGMKPAIFEIHVNGVLLSQNAENRDYQKELEKTVLQMDYKSFKQVVVLGSASYLPFMQLTKADRRSLIEDLLDIRVFTHMAKIVKEKTDSNKEEMRIVGEYLRLREEKKTFIEKNLEALRKTSESRIRVIEQAMAIDRQTLASCIKDVESFLQEIDLLKASQAQYATVHADHTKLSSTLFGISSNIKAAKKDLDFYGKNDDCPVCRQAIDGGFKAEIVTSKESYIQTETETMSTVMKDLDEVVVKIQMSNDIASKITDLNSAVLIKKNVMKDLSNRIKASQAEIDAISNSDTLIKSNEAELASTITDITTYTTKKAELLKSRELLDVSSILLKDGGIKTKIIRKYLPIINKMINKYLTKMGFMVSFELDEEFGETIKSRYRDKFSYYSFSEGEKQRIDLAILLTWRHIAKLRNSVDTNLLIFDEVFDKSLDGEGEYELHDIILTMMTDNNVIVISPKLDHVADKYTRVCRFKKVKNFSVMEIE